MQVKKPEPAVVDLQKMPQILTLEELERKLAGVRACMRVCVHYACMHLWMCGFHILLWFVSTAHHVEDEGEEVTDPQRCAFTCTITCEYFC